MKSGITMDRYKGATGKMRDFFKELYHIWISERPTVLAAALAYFGMFSLAPVIFIAFTFAGIFINEVILAERAMERFTQIFSPEVVQFIEQAVSNISGTYENSAQSGAWIFSLVSFVALLWAASGLFFQLQYALNTVWNVPPPPEKRATLVFIKQRIFSFVMVLAIGVLLVVASITNLVITWLGSFIDVLNAYEVSSLLVLIGLVWLSLVLIYKFVPEVKVRLRDVWMGALVAAVLETLLIFILGFVLRIGKFDSALAAAGSIAVILIGMYYAMQILLFGVVFTRVYAAKYGSMRDPDDNSSLLT